MLTKPDTFRTLITALGGVSAFASVMEIGEFAAKKMRDRNSVAVEYWPKLVEVSRAHGYLYTTDDFVGMKLRSRSPEKGAA